eukprot:Skav236086  [mRNA]  locus=scaffold1166:51413:67706:+ [translate_table: standard]
MKPISCQIRKHVAALVRNLSRQGALSELDLKSFQGRLLRLCAAKQKPAAESSEQKAGLLVGDVERTRLAFTDPVEDVEERKKKVDAHLEHTWNLLYVSANAAADAASAQLGMSKSELFGKDAENSAASWPGVRSEQEIHSMFREQLVRQNLLKAAVAKVRKAWLQREGIRVDAFEQKGTALTNSKAILPEDAKRRDDTLIDSWHEVGWAVNCWSGKLLQWHSQSCINLAELCSSGHVPLYLEWAPEDVQLGLAYFFVFDVTRWVRILQESRGYLFVKNLNFKTTDDSLKATFRKCQGFRSAVIMRKKSAVKKGEKKDRWSIVTMPKCCQDDSLVTRNLVPGESVYGEKRLVAESADGEDKIEYRVWNPFRSKLGAGIVGGIGACPVKPGAKVLYLGGVVYAVEFSHRSGRDLTNMAKRRPNVVPIVEDARQPQRYRMLIGMVDVIFSDVAQPDQARIVTHNAGFFLKNGGWVMISIKANCVDSTAAPEAVFASEIDKLRKDGEQLTLEPYHRDHALVVGIYRASKKKKEE